MKSARLFALLPLLALAGCNSGSTGGGGAENAAPAEKLRVGLVTSGDVNDQGWNQLAYEGVQAVAAKGAQESHQVAKSKSEQIAAMRQLADDGTAIVYCHGFEYGEPAIDLGKKFPGTDFVVVGGVVSQEPNVASLVPKIEDATYLCGMAAAGLTKTKKIGMIGGQLFPTVQSAFDAFEDGVHAVDPKIEVTVKYVDSWDDQNKGKEIAKNLIAAGADVLIQNADQAGKGAFAAAKESTAAGKTVYMFGTNRDQNQVAPNVTVASAIIDLPKAFQGVADSVQAKIFKGELIELNLKNDDISVSWNSALKSKIPAPVMKKIDEASAKIKAGTLETKRKK